MANIPLFHETQSEIFLILTSIINDIHKGSQLTEDDIISRFPHIDWINIGKLHDILHVLFHFNDDGYASMLTHNSSIDYLAVTSQLRWLKSMLLEPECDFIISDKLRLKLLQQLPDIAPLIDHNFIQVIRERGDAAFKPEMSRQLQIIWQALKNKRKLQYQYVSRQGQAYQDIAAPCRLEYDCSQHRIRLILWLEADHRAIKLNVNKDLHLRLTDIGYGPETEAAFKDFLHKSQTSVALELSRKFNAVDRCFALFAPYDKQAFYDADNDTYRLVINYYRFDEEEIIDFILSLGAAVTVISPQPLRSKLVSRLKQQYRLCQPQQSGSS